MPIVVLALLVPIAVLLLAIAPLTGRASQALHITAAVLAVFAVVAVLATVAH